MDIKLALLFLFDIHEPSCLRKTHQAVPKKSFSRYTTAFGSAISSAV